MTAPETPLHRELRARGDGELLDAALGAVSPVVAEHVQRLRVQEEARAIVAAERARESFAEPPSTLDLSSELAIEDGPLAYTIADLHPTGSNSLLAAPFKSGKTTLTLNLVRALADREPFLTPQFVTALQAGRRVAWLNYELSPVQARTWLRRLGLRNPSSVSVLHLRGYQLPLWEDSVRGWIRDWLRHRCVGFLIVDPVARSLAGLSENSNDDVTRFTDAFDQLKREAEVDDALLVTHTGRALMEEGDERARGATRFDDWADVRWVYTRVKSGPQRFLSATGRDVEVPEFGLAFDAETMRLTPDGFGFSRQIQAIQNLAVKVHAAVTAKPGLTVTDLRTTVTGKATSIAQAIEMAEALGWIRVEIDGQRKRHYPATTAEPEPPHPPSDATDPPPEQT